MFCWWGAHNDGILPRQYGRVKSKGNAIGGIALVLSLDLNCHSHVSIYRGTLVFFLQTGMATGPGSMFSKLRFRDHWPYEVSWLVDEILLFQ